MLNDPPEKMAARGERAARRPGILPNLSNTTKMVAGDAREAAVVAHALDQ